MLRDSQDISAPRLCAACLPEHLTLVGFLAPRIIRSKPLPKHALDIQHQADPSTVSSMAGHRELDADLL